MKKICISIILICASVFAIQGCSKRTVKSQSEVVPVQVMKVEVRDIQVSLEYVGSVRAQETATIYPRVSGKIIEKLKEDGDTVSKGDIIAYIDRDEVGFVFEKAPVDSFLSGIIGRMYVDKGMSVTPQTPIAMVVDMDKIEIELDIPEKYLPKISLSQIAEVSVQAYPDERFMGTVSKISPVLDLETRTAPIEIIISNSDHRLKPGMFAKVNLIIEEHKNVPVILKEAIMGKGPQKYVYVVDENIASKREINLGIRQGAYYEILEGLKEGDLVITVGQQRLSDGATVNIEKER